jgi:hypothetical protein
VVTGQVRHPSELRWVEVDEPGLGLSIQVPEGWSRVGSGPPLQVQAPEADGYRLTIRYDDAAIDPPTEEGFRRMAEGVADLHARQYEAYVELHRSMVGVGGIASAAVHYRWHPELLGRDIEALWVAAPVAVDRAVTIDASAAVGVDDPLAVARWVITSTRFGDSDASPTSFEG